MQCQALVAWRSCSSCYGKPFQYRLSELASLSWECKEAMPLKQSPSQISNDGCSRRNKVCMWHRSVFTWAQSAGKGTAYITYEEKYKDCKNVSRGLSAAQARSPLDPPSRTSRVDIACALPSLQNYAVPNTNLSQLFAGSVLRTYGSPTRPNEMWVRNKRVLVFRPVLIWYRRNAQRNQKNVRNEPV